MVSLSLYIKQIRKNGQRYFSINQLMADQGLSKNAALNAIHRMRERGELISPAKGLYVTVPPEHQDQGCIPPQELIPLVMKYLGANYYVSLLSAGVFHGATHQKPAKISFKILN